MRKSASHDAIAARSLWPSSRWRLQNQRPNAWLGMAHSLRVRSAMTDAQRTWSIELLLLENGSVSVRADEAGSATGALRRVEQNPAAAVCAVEKWLEHHEAGAITVVLRTPQASIAIWTSPCASLALHRMASLFGNDWTPGFEMSDSAADESSDDPRTTGVRTRVCAASLEAGQPARQAGRGVA
jgi:hypothetical protein